jgi:hypothetical protein
MLKAFHIDSLPDELDTFKFQACPLLMSSVTAKLDLATRTQDAMPWELVQWIGS